MDLLLTPAFPAFPTDDTPYLAGDNRWERGHFPTYAGRGHVSILANLKTLTRQGLNGFLQTWLFFGLVAEFLGLNEQEDGTYIIDPSQAEYELDFLYENSLVVKEDGNKYITGASILALVPIIQQRIVATAGDDIVPRLAYLDNCLLITYQILLSSSYTTVGLVHSIRYSLAALGELFSTAIRAVNFGLQLGLKIESFAEGWECDYLVAGGRLEGQMLAHGWCPSEIEKVRTRSYKLNPMHYVSRLKKIGPWRGHSRCNKYRCRAFQISMDEYQPAHAEQCHGCNLLDVDLDGVKEILGKTHSFPVLTDKTAWSVMHERDEVWADGLGNPTANSLPRCQIERLVRLVANLQSNVDSDRREKTRTPYRIWADPLCCPVESIGKSIALDRMADVYRNATHVLVLDSSFTSYPSEGVDPAELLFRAVSFSAWMRRLWTFQEGALAHSLYYQFADRAVTSEMLLSEILEAGARDIRYQVVGDQLSYDIKPFEEFTPQNKESGVSERMPQNSAGFSNWLWHLQEALNFRSVSVPKDEPLCIATILGLDTKRVISENGEHATQKRMAMVWEMIAERLGGIPPRTVFYVDNPLDIVGFRWAPRCLLAADVQQSTVDDTNDPYAERPFFVSALGLVQRSNRFLHNLDTKLAQLVSGGDRRGLRNSYPGFRAYARPYSGMGSAPEQYRLHPWDGVLQNVEGLLLLNEKETGRWFRVCKYGATSKSQPGPDINLDDDICNVMHTGQCAIIRQNAETILGFNGMPMIEIGLLVLVDQESETEVVVRRHFSVELKEATRTEAIVAETMTEIAEELASEQVTADFVTLRDQTASAEYGLAKDILTERMKELVAWTWEARPDFANAAAISEGEDMKEYMWKYLAARFSHRVLLERMPDDQLWLID